MSIEDLLKGHLTLHRDAAPSEDALRALGLAINQHIQNDETAFQNFLTNLNTWTNENFGALLGPLRDVLPVLVLGKCGLVTSFSGVKYILDNDSDFLVTYGEKMKSITEGANFFLGMDDNDPDGTANRAAMALVFRREDIPTRIAPTIARYAQEVMGGLGDRFDVVKDYLRVVPARFAIDYFGFTAMDETWLYRVTETLFNYIFIDIKNDPTLDQSALEQAGELRAALDREIARPIETVNPDTVLGRALRLSRTGEPAFGAINLRNNFLGLLIGLVPTTAKAAAMALDLLTSSEDHRATLDQSLAGQDPDFETVVREAMRLTPINPGLFRKAARDCAILSDGGENKVAKDTMILVGTAPAMQDPKHIAHPGRLLAGRSEAFYLTYGHGLHACFGRYINDLHVTTLLRTLFESGPFTRADGEDGKLVFEGPFPGRLILQR